MMLHWVLHILMMTIACGVPICCLLVLPTGNMSLMVEADSPCVSCDHLWTYKGFSTGTDLSSAEASESRSKHDWTHRVGSRRWLELATGCSNPPTDAQCNYNAHALSCTNFVANVGAGQLLLMVACSGHGLLLILGCALWIKKWKR